MRSPPERTRLARVSGPTAMLESFINVVHVTVCAILILVVLLQQGRGGGLGSATSAQVFGGRGAGNFMTRLTGICAALFMLTSVTLAYIASSGDAELREYEKQQQQQK